ncbi:hypothetical protein HUT06_40925 [Actinomadura sp. NAK00032]|uniref:hypothetical protein n=1 Tax=Actinomadura sp. NAK00032 TaxID=2742128 RepID=UPI0015918AA2|nr:hypothetical protein [Actinomadura sp. NAK00032]QKW39612.1 hypothetical protein HUT06_40925 [Actinomadura sp. NAK00032]
MTGDEPAGGTIDLNKRPGSPQPGHRPQGPHQQSPRQQGPAWIVVPARVVALIVVLPLRLVHDLFVLLGRGLRGIGRALYRWLLAPLGRLAAAIGRGIAAVLDFLIVRPLRWLAVVVVLGFLRWFGRGTGRLARWFHRVLLAPVGRFFAMLGRGLGRLLELVLVRPLVWLVSVLIVLPLVLLWRYVLRPPLLVLAWLGRAVWGGLTWLGRGTLLVLGALAAGVVWSWRALGRCLGWLGRVLFVIPARALWRYVLAPIVAGAASAWRLAARVLRWLWRTLVVFPVLVLVVAPARWVGTHVLRPIGHGIAAVWRVSVLEPARAVRRTMRQASQDVRLALRRTFRGY